uniref:5'-nucleotidase, cytosolic IIIB n=1 Tax=Paramormyrops kingsleyae TaxID=1676925 RepID=A0A3B3Q7X8_9TELE
VAQELVMSDFDMTLTRFAYNGARCPTCYAILEDSVLISGDCKKMLKDLLNKYYPIEFDASRTVEEKVPDMVDWWTKAHELLIEQKIQKDQLARVVKDSNAMLRKEYKFFFDHLDKKEIPLVIFSAGIGDVLEEVIIQAGVFHSNIMVFSNYMDFDEKVEDWRESYLNRYDIVLEKDETMDVPNAILRYITGHQ